MSAQALYRRWRPQSFDDVIGQDHITLTLRNAVRTDRLAHAYLFTGLRGTGKTSVARILAKAVNCTGEGEPPCNACAICVSITEGRSLDLIEIDAASNTGVDDVRELRDKIGFAPNEARFKVYIIDEVHMLSTAAFNALLKTLEEPPEHALFILATTEPHKIPDTILSRCQRHDFRRMSVGDVADKLAEICDSEGVEADRAALERIARAGTGSMRDAESLLDQVIATGQAVSVERVRDVLGTPGIAAVARMVDALIDGDASAALEQIAESMDRGTDPGQLRERLLDHLRGLLLLQTGAAGAVADRPDDQIAVMRRQAGAISTSHLVAAIHRVNDARPSPDRSQPSLPLELAMIESVLEMVGTEAIDLPGRGAVRGASGAATTTPRATNTGDTAPSSATEDDGTVDAQGGTSDDDDGRSSPAATGPDDDHRGDGSERATPAPPKGDQPASEETERTDAGSHEVDAVDAGRAGRAREEGGARAASEDGLVALRSAWDGVVAAVASADRNTAALLKDCRPVAVDGHDVTLGFYYEFHCKRASERERKSTIAGAVSDVVGGDVNLLLHVVPPSPDEDAARPRNKADRAGADPVVRHALDELGGKISGVRSDPGSGS